MDSIGQEMDIFETHGDITRDYRDYIKSFIQKHRGQPLIIYISRSKCISDLT